MTSTRSMGSTARSVASDDHAPSKSSHDRFPLPANRSTSTTAIDRPRTSSGPDSKKPKGKLDNSQHFRSRDDTHVPDMVTKGTAQRSYHIPIRGKAPSPDSSPDSRSRSPPATTIVRTTTPDSLSEPAETGLVTIGMALGSPSHPPGPEMRPRQITRAMTASAAAPIPEPQQQQAREEAQVKGKTRKWGIFGRSKTTKRGRSATESATTSPPSTTQQQFGISPPPQANFVRQGSPQVVASPVRNKPMVTRSQTAPLIGEVPASRKKNTGTSYQTTQMARKPLPVQPTSVERKPLPPAKSVGNKPKPQLLNVDIPSIEMERYSIMFGSVLQPNSGSSSLLARRQATLEKLRMLKDEATREEEGLALKPPPRRATSPNPGRQSPSFSLFPSTPGKASSPQVPSPRGRSYTSPALLPSPSQLHFALSPQEAEIYLQRNGTPTTSSPRVKQRSATTPDRFERESSRERAKLHKPRSSSKLRNPQVLVESPRSVDDETSTSNPDSKPLPAVQEDEPQWQMVSQSSLASSNSAAVSDPNSVPRSHSATSTPVQDAKKKAEDEAQKALRDAVENSIRRQISMSQQQRQMLRPQHLNASPLASSTSNRKDASPQGVGIAKNVIPRVVVGSNERLSETKSSTPTLVHPGALGPSPLTNRKSERIVLDNA
jgi:hypothetical protein